MPEEEAFALEQFFTELVAACAGADATSLTPIDVDGGVRIGPSLDFESWAVLVPVPVPVPVPVRVTVTVRKAGKAAEEAEAAARQRSIVPTRQWLPFLEASRPMGSICDPTRVLRQSR